MDKKRKAVNRSIRMGWLIVLLFSSVMAFSQAQDTVRTDTTQVKASRNTFKTLFRGKPGRAALYSLLLPSAGQIYNKRWWKVPVVIGAEGFLVYNMLQKKSTFKDYDTRFQNLVNGGTDDIFPNASTAKTYRDNARTNYEYAWVYLGLAHIIQVFDAFVDRHLLEFDTSDNISFQQFPSTSGSYPSFGLAIRLQ